MPITCPRRKHRAQSAEKAAAEVTACVSGQGDEGTGSQRKFLRVRKEHGPALANLR